MRIVVSNFYKRATIFDFKPVDCGPGSERTSLEIDKIVYGAEISPS